MLLPIVKGKYIHGLFHLDFLILTILYSDIVSAITAKTSFKDSEEQSRILAGLRWLGLFSDDKIIPRGNPLDTLCATLEQKMQYGEKERDMVMLQHRFEIELANGKKVKTRLKRFSKQY